MPLSDRPIQAGSREAVVISDAQNPGNDGVTTTHIAVGTMALDVNVVRSVAAGGGGGDVNIFDAAGNPLTSTTVGPDQALDVNIVAGAGAGGTSMTDDAAFTVGTTGVTPAAGTYRSVRDTVDDNDAGALAMTQRRALLTCVETPAGDSAMDEANDALRVNVVAGVGGTSMTDDAAFTPGTTDITPAGAMFDDAAPDSVDEGDGGVVRMSANRNLYVTMRDAAGNERGLNIAADNTLGINDAGGDISIDDGGNSITVDDGGIALSVDDGGTPLDGNLAQVGGVATATTAGNVDAGTQRVVIASDQVSLTVDNTVLSVVGGGTEATAQRVTIANNSTGVLTVDGTITASNTAGDVADDAADSGNPVKIGGVAVETDGTDPTSVTAEGDRAEIRTDMNRRMLVNTGHPNAWVTNNNYGAAQTNQQQKAAPGANLSLYIQRFIISTDAAVNIKLVDDTAGAPATILGPYYIAANAGANIHLEPPVRIDANTDIGITSSAATNHTVTITGFTAP